MQRFLVKFKSGRYTHIYAWTKRGAEAKIRAKYGDRAIGFKHSEGWLELAIAGIGMMALLVSLPFWMVILQEVMR